MRVSYAALTRWSVGALVAGLVLGLVGHLTAHPLFAAAGTVASGIGELWISALRMITLPLALAMMLAATTSARTGTVGSLGARALLLIWFTLVATGVVTLLATSALMSQYAVDPVATAAMTSGVVIPDAVAGASSMTFARWFSGLMPRNIFEAAARGDMLPVLLFVMMFGFAVSRLPDEHRVPLKNAAQSISQAMQVIVGWLLYVMPLGVLALTYVMTLRTGAKLAGMLGVYLLLQPVVAIVWTLVMYPLTVIFGRTPLGAFARAVAPAQLVAVSTRSSVAALPALLEGGRQHVGLNETATNFLLPLNVSVFRVSESFTNCVKLVFLAHIFGIPLYASTVAAFLVTIVVYDFSGTGTPNSGGGIGYRMVPVFAAAGIPIEGVMVLEAVETIPDIFATMANVTAQMSATVILSRYAERREAAAGRSAIGARG